RIPAALLASNDPAVYAAFIRGLFEADGNVLAGTVLWSTVHAQFADEVRSILLALGLPTSTRQYQSGWGGMLNELRLRNLSYVAAYREKVRFISTRKQGLLRVAPYEQAARYDYIHLAPEVVHELVPAGAPLSNAVELSRQRHS